MTLEDHRKHTIMTTAIKDIRVGIILDVGCSKGDAYLEPILRTGLEVVGLDLNHSHIEIAKNWIKSHENFHPIIADAQYLPFRKKSLDRIICGEVIEHLPRPQLLLRAAHISLKESGILILTTPNKTGLQELGSRFLSKLRSIKQKLCGVEKIEEVFHISLYTYGALWATLALEGFKVREVISQGIGVNKIIQEVIGRSILPALEIRISGKLPKQIQRGWIISNKSHTYRARVRPPILACMQSTHRSGLKKALL